MRVLIVKLGAIGDVIHTLPALAALRRALPFAHIAWVAEKGGPARLLDENPCLDELIEFDTRGWRRELFRRETLRDFRESLGRIRGYDVAIDFQGLMKSGAIAWLSRAGRRIGFEARALREPASAMFLTGQVSVDDRDHVIRKNLTLLSALGISPAGEYEFPIGTSDDDRRMAESLISRLGPDLAIINPGGGWQTKLWAPENFGRLADRLWESFGWKSIITYGPGEGALAKSVVSNARTGTAEMVDLTLKQFFEVAKRSRLFVGGDTGPLHLAAAARTPIVGIYGPTPSQRNGPFATDDLVVERDDLDCRENCFRRVCSHTSCMKMPVDMIWQGVIKRAGNTQSRMKELV